MSALQLVQERNVVIESLPGAEKEVSGEPPILLFASAISSAFFCNLIMINLILKEK